MKKVNKLLCIVLAFAMMLIPMSVCAAPADGKTVALHLSAENTTVSRGDTITLSLTVDVADWDSVWGLPCFYLMYNDAIFAPASDFKTNKTAMRMPMGDFGEYVVAENGLNNTITSSNYSAVSKKFATAGESATDFTGGVAMTFAVNNDAGYTTGGGIQYTDADTVQIEFYLNVAEDAAYGTYKVGLPYAAYLANKAYFNCCDTGKAVRVPAAKIDVSDAVVEITVAEETAASIVNPMKGQIRFDKNENGGYAGTFDVRAIARITGTDFDATFGSIAAAKEMITSVGFVFAQGSGDYAEMVAVAEAGESGNGYTYAPVDFISTSFDEGNYTFSCIVDDVENKNDSLVALAYITYVDADGETQTAVYTDVQTVSFADLYDRNFNSVFGA